MVFAKPKKAQFRSGKKISESTLGFTEGQLREQNRQENMQAKGVTIQVRPEGAPISENVDITKQSIQERRRNKEEQAKNQQENLAVQQEALAKQQSEELVNLNQQDFTKLGQTEKPQMTPENTFNGLGNVKQQLEAQLPLDVRQQQFTTQTAGQVGGASAGLIGGSLLGGALLSGASSVALPTINFARITTSAKEGIASIKGIKLLGAGALTYGYNLLTSGKQKALESDISDLRGTAKKLSTAVAQGGDPVQARLQLLEIENAIKDKLTELNSVKKYNIKDRLTGDDIQEYAELQLLDITLRRQALERFMLDGDVNKYQQYALSQDLEDGK